MKLKNRIYPQFKIQKERVVLILVLAVNTVILVIMALELYFSNEATIS
jgi:hypothetical protein